MIKKSMPLPIKSSMYTQKNCKIRMNRHTANVNMKGPIKDRRLNKYSRGNNFNMGFQVTLLILTQS